MAGPSILECVINISEGRDQATLADLRVACGPALLDWHRDGDHNRSVFTVGGPGGVVEQAVRDLVSAAVAALDLRAHSGVHPRIGVVDVVPFVALTYGEPTGVSATASGGASGGGPTGPHEPTGQSCYPGHSGPTETTGAIETTSPTSPTGRRLVNGPIEVAVAARDRFCRWAATELALPCFVYGPERTLPEVRRRAWRSLAPDYGPTTPDPRTGACAAGARRMLVAYNLWLGTGDVALARRLAAEVRAPALRTLGLAVSSPEGEAMTQVSCNLIDPLVVGPDHAYDSVAAALPGGVGIERAELVGLIPAAVLDRIPPHRWAELDLDAARTIEARLEQAGLDGGSEL